MSAGSRNGNNVNPNVTSHPPNTQTLKQTSLLGIVMHLLQYYLIVWSTTTSPSDNAHTHVLVFTKPTYKYG